MKIAFLQSDSLPFDKAKINYYLRIAHAEKAKIFALPEYVLNRFFKELEKMPLSFIKNQTKHQIKLLKQLSLSYNMTILAPVVLIKGDKKYKVLAKFYKSQARYYPQQVYMPYSHWNEDKFFDKKSSKPLVFNVGKYKAAALFGFESHFDEFWKYFREKKVDIVFVSSVSTFNSHQRWYEMLKTRAFLNNMYVIRINRVGEYEDWNFYGKSFAVDPEGENIVTLGMKEELGIIKVSKDALKEARREWKFGKLSKELNFN
jgi:nitrilase